MDTPIAAALQPFVDRGALAGAVTVVADRDKILSLETVGYADIGQEQAMTPDTLFWVASQTKPVTGAAVMMLVDEGKLSLDDPVSKLLPEFADQRLIEHRDGIYTLLRRPRSPVTLRTLMNHTSGLPFASPVEHPTLDRLPLDVAVRSYALLPLQTPPGYRYQYSNAGINSGARMLEVATGEPYERFLDQRLFEPLGMSDTTFWPNGEQTQRLARAYRPDASGLTETPISQLQYPLSARTRYPMPAGGLFSTARDMATFCQMVLNGGTFQGRRYLSEGAIEEMTRRQTPARIPESYGVGWAVGPNGFGHGGALSTNMHIDKEKGLVTVFLVQHAGYPEGQGQKIQEAFQAGVQQILQKVR